ncbi:MAG: MFS transporter, partial [Clostridia bacterium]
LVGIVILIGKVWDAITDPIMGAISDRTHSRCGKRRIYLLVGAPLVLISYILMWHSFGITSVSGLVAYYIFAYILFSTVITIVMVPYNSMLPEMVKDYSERTSYTAVRMIFSVVAAAIAGLIPGMIVGGGPHNNPKWTENNFLLIGIIFGALFSVCILLCFFGTKGSVEQQSSNKEKFGNPFKGFVSVFANKAFRRYIPIHIFGQGMTDFLTGLIVCFLAVYNRRESYTAVMATMLITQVLSMIVMPKLAKKMGKTAPTFVGFGILTIALLFVLFVNSSTPTYVFLLIAFFGGLGSAASSLVPYSILPDMSDVDELITTKRREGTYSGVATFSRKLVNGITLFIISLLTGAVGYSTTTEVFSESVQWGIKLMFVGGPIVMMALTMVFAKLYRLNNEKHNIIMQEIEYRRENDGKSIADKGTIAICEEITGKKFEELWDEKNG